MQCQQDLIHPQIMDKFNGYPEDVRGVLLEIRSLILETISSKNLGTLEETLKWGEPSYLVKNGSAVRFDWKPKYPESYFMFFNCKTKLVDTFKELYSQSLRFEGNRAIVLNLDEPIPYTQLRHYDIALNSL